MDLEGHIVGGRYEVKKRLQSGFYGVTWLCTDRKTMADICLKTFVSESKMQRKEILVLKEMCDNHFKHQNICQVLDVCLERAEVTTPQGLLTGKLQYVVFEYCSGSDLFNYLCTGPFEKRKRVSNFPEPLARHYFTQALLGIMYLHERGVFHRDIKPENCVLDSNLDLKLTDFGTNKILVSDDPMQVLRTRTRGIGTETYRAPEVNSGKAYNPAAADVWGLGVMLFFFVGVEQMVTRAQCLDPYTRECFAPLGIFFPFPLHCSKLDSYLKRESDLRNVGFTGSVKGPSLSNNQFWAEWRTIKDVISPELVDLFNRIFVLEPSLRITLRDIAIHPWVNTSQRVSPGDIKAEMMDRCPSSISMPSSASPSVLSKKLLGGVDQATLRDTLSGSGKEEVDFPEDSEVWMWSEAMKHLESIQLMLVGADIQELISDLSFVIQVLKELLANPTSEDTRTVPIRLMGVEWLAQFLLVLGFLPQELFLYLSLDNLDLTLISHAVALLESVHLAVTRSAISTSYSSSEEEEEEDVLEEMEGVDSGETNSGPLVMHQPSIPSLPLSLNQFSQEEDMGADTPIVSSQGSWSQYAASSQSSQEELPECLQLVRDWSADFSQEHQLLPLSHFIEVRTSKQYQAAAEFCKLSGLLCSYGLYQVVCHTQLAVYCRGNQTSFSARIMCTPTTKSGTCQVLLSTWCFAGRDEWLTILERLQKDV